MWRDFPLPDGSYSDPTRPWSQQDLVNYIPVFAEQSGTRTRARYTPAPGLQTFASVGNGPIRGMRDVEGTLFVVSGNHLYRVTKTGVATSLGTIPGSGLVCMTHNQITDGNQVVVGNGLSGYLYNTVTESFTQITDTAFPGLISCDFLGQYIIGVEPQRRFWFHSDLVDATSYSDLNRYEAESAPDRIVGLIASHNEVLIFGERTIEPWVNEPTENAAFVRNSSAVIEKGCASGQTICRLDNSVYFLGNDKIVYRLEGYTPVPVSTKPMAAAFRDLDASRAFAFTYEDSGHVIYYLTFPDGQTWGYDVSTRRWHRRESWTLNRWRLNCLTKSNGEWIGGDFQNGRLYKVVWNLRQEDAEPLVARMRSGVLHNNGNRAQIHGFKLLANTGTPGEIGASVSTLGIAGDFPDGALGDAVSYSYTVTPAFSGQAWSLAVVSGALPTGVSMSSAGVFTGSRTALGTFTWTVELRDEHGVAVAQLVDHSHTWGADAFNPETTAVRYKVVAPSDTTDYSSPSYDASAWSTGYAPFGNEDNAVAASVGFALHPATLWPLGQKLWYRANVVLTSTTGLSMDIYRDDAATVWVNGTQVYDNESAGASGLGAFYNTFTIPSADLVVGANSLVIRSRELYGGNSYLDYRLNQSGYTPPDTTPSDPSVVTVLGTASAIPSGTLQLRYSDDGAYNYSDWRDLDTGRTGTFVKEMVTRRLGMTRQRVWELRDSSTNPIDILGAEIE